MTPTLKTSTVDKLKEFLIKCLRRVASPEFRPAFQSREALVKCLRRVATRETKCEFNRRYATKNDSYCIPGVETPV